MMDKGMKAAEDMDMAVSDAVSSTLPKPSKPYSPRAYQQLVDALRRVADAFGIPYEPEVPAGPVAEIDSESARMLAMVMEAAGDYGAELPDVASLENENGLTIMVGELMDLAGDPEFVSFLGSEAPEMEMEEEDDMSEEEISPKDVIRSKFMSRMK